MRTYEKRYLDKIKEWADLLDELGVDATSTETIVAFFREALTDAYLEGYANVRIMLEELLDSDYVEVDSIDAIKVKESVYREIEGMTFEDRLLEYLSKDDVNAFDEYELPQPISKSTSVELKRLLDTEYHRVFNEGGFDQAKTQKGLYKIWTTAGDFNVRETHSYLEGMRVPIDAKFYTYDGDSALYPSGFKYAENNVNCRCVLRYDREVDKTQNTQAEKP